MTPLRLGVVGCGAVAERYHLPAVAASADVELAVLVDPAVERAERLAAEFDAAAVAPDHGSLPGSVDAAIVATPNRLHAPVAAALLRAGIHVLVEKPLARTVAECDEIVAAAEAGHATAAVGHDFRHFPVARAAQALLEGDLLGRLESVDVRQSAGSGWPYASQYVLSREEAGGGVLMDFGVHVFDLLSWWLGPLVVRDYADDAAGGVETDCVATLEARSGIPVTLELSRLRALRDTFVVVGERATVEIGIFEPALLRLTPASADRAVEGRVPDAEFDAAPLRTVFSRQLADFVDAVRTGREPLVTLEQGRRPVELVERCYALRRSLRHPWDWPEVEAVLGRQV